MRLDNLPIQKKALLVSELALAILCAYRFYDYVTTGFFVSDEFGYYYAATHGTIYGGRWFFGDVNILLFKIPGLANVDAFAKILPFYLFFWSGITIYLFYRILLLLNFDERTVALSLISSFALISFVLLSLGFLTEPVGLSLAMGGIYCILRFLRSETVAGRLAFPFLTAILFGFAGATREPYDAFLIAGVVLVGFVAINQMRRSNSLRIGDRGIGRKTLALLSIVIFLIPAAALYNANSAGTSQVPSIAEQIVQAAVTNPSTAVASVTTTTTVTSTGLTTITQTITTNGTISTITSTSTTTTTTTTAAVVSPPAYPFYAKSLVLNTLVIFIGGIALGWGPLALIFGLFGFFMLFRRSLRSRESTDVLLLMVSLVALASYLVVSFVFAPDPSYFSFQNYSTILRFSDTTLPAYFLMAPLFLSTIAKSRKRVMAMATIAVAFLLLGVPAYEVYASSNFNFTTGNPFQLSYRTEAAQIRDYVDTNLVGVSVTLIGIPYGWAFTPGVQDLPSVHAYDIVPDPLFPYLTAQNFSALHPTTILIFDGYPAYLTSQAPWLVPFLNDTSPNGSVGGSSYTITSSKVVVSNSAFQLIEDQVAWSAPE